MKKFTALLMCIVILFAAALPCVAQEVYPESEHEYANNEHLEWTYTVPGAIGLYVSFSDDTYIEPGIFGGIFIQPSETGDITVGDVMTSIIGGHIRFGDTLFIYGSDGLVGSYDGNELAGATVYVPGDTLTIVLSTDEEGTAYGFKVTDIKAVTEADRRTVTYHPECEKLREYTKDFFVQVNPTADKKYNDGNYFGSQLPEDSAFAGWSTTPGGEVAYDGGDEIITNGENVDLYAVWVPLCLNEDETYWFSNSSYYFDVSEEQNYYLTKEEYNRIQSNLYKVYGLGPMPSVALSIVLAHLPQFEFRGSCYGMSTTVALQHFGYIDMLHLQDADSVVDLDPEENLISYINYYQAQAATSYLTENKAWIQGNANYKASLKNLWESASQGNLCMFTYYTGNVFVTSGHTVLITGAYDDAKGNHVLISYNCNYPSRYMQDNYIARYYISPDWSEIRFMETGDTLGAINWTDDFSQFTSFDINGNGNPLTWYKSMLDHIVRFFANIKNVFAMMFN